MALLAELTVWQCIKWFLTALVISYLLKEYVFKSKQKLSSEERAKRRYLLANVEVIRLMSDKERE